MSEGYTDEEKQRLLDAILLGWCDECSHAGDGQGQCPVCGRILDNTP